MYARHRGSLIPCASNAFHLVAIPFRWLADTRPLKSDLFTAFKNLSLFMFYPFKSP